MDEHREDEEYESSIDWDEAFKDMMKQGEEDDEVRYIEGELKLYASPIGFEFQFCDGKETRAYLVTDVQAAQLALTIMAIIQNR